MRTRVLAAAGAAVALGITMAGCGSSSSGGGGGGGGSSQSAASGAPINLGVVTSLTGGYASGFTTVENGVKARLAVENAKGGIGGHKLTYTMTDDASTPQGALAAVNKLAKQEKVFGILDASPVFYGGAAAAKAAQMPVSGVSFDGGSAWTDPSYTTFFDAYGQADFSLVATTWGEFFKSQGCTKVGAIGNTGPSSGRAASAAVASAVHAGLAKGYLDSKLSPGTTDVGPSVIGIKSTGTDCLYVPVTPSLAFALTAGLKQAGVTTKAVVLATGYGGDILASKPSVEAAQGIDFTSAGAPVEADTAATKAFQAALKQYAGVTGVPTFGEYVGWTVADLFIHGLQLAGGDASQADFVKALRGSSDWDAGGLYPHAVDYSDPAPLEGGLSPGNCLNVVKLTGEQFVPIAGANPVCGEIIKGVTVSQ